MGTTAPSGADDQPDVIRLAEWDKGGRGTFLKRVHRLMAEADIIVGHNIDRADVPWLKGDFYLPRIGHAHRPTLATLPPFKTVDTLKVLRRELGSGASRRHPRPATRSFYLSPEQCCGSEAHHCPWGQHHVTQSLATGCTTHDPTRD